MDKGRRSHSRHRHNDSSKNFKRDLKKEYRVEAEEEAMERRAREKEAAYLKRLGEWEDRERRKAKQAENKRELERLLSQKQQRRVKSSKMFLRDYDDKRDDPKYYGRRELQRRLFYRRKERERDSRDRQIERETVKESEGIIHKWVHLGPEVGVEFLRRRWRERRMPSLLVRVHPPSPPQQPSPLPTDLRSSRPPPPEQSLVNIQPPPPHILLEIVKRYQPPEAEDKVCGEGANAVTVEVKEEKRNHVETEGELRSDEENQTSRVPMVSSEDKCPSFAIPASNATQMKNSPSGNATTALDNSVPAQPSTIKKLVVTDVLKTNNDYTNLSIAKKPELAPLDSGKEKKRTKNDVTNSREERRKRVRTAIEKIPTEKKALFAFQLDWAAVDNQLVDRRLRPWINRKIIERFGEPEPIFVELMCFMILAGSEPQSLLAYVQLIFEDEAELFMLNLWRLLIYAIEEKKLGLVKCYR